jgi:hypothetical protein
MISSKIRSLHNIMNAFSLPPYNNLHKRTVECRVYFTWNWNPLYDMLSVMELKRRLFVHIHEYKSYIHGNDNHYIEDRHVISFSGIWKIGRCAVLKFIGATWPWSDDNSCRNLCEQHPKKFPTVVFLNKL